jgi:hypothetical protein
MSETVLSARLDGPNEGKAIPALNIKLFVRSFVLGVGTHMEDAYAAKKNELKAEVLANGADPERGVYALNHHPDVGVFVLIVTVV